MSLTMFSIMSFIIPNISMNPPPCSTNHQNYTVTSLAKIRSQFMTSQNCWYLRCSLRSAKSQSSINFTRKCNVSDCSVCINHNLFSFSSEGQRKIPPSKWLSIKFLRFLFANFPNRTQYFHQDEIIGTLVFVHVAHHDDTATGIDKKWDNVILPFPSYRRGPMQ